MKTLVTLCAISVLLIGCSDNSPQQKSATLPSKVILSPEQHPEMQAPLGSSEWFHLIDSIVGITDKQGHGPDIGSAEWCDAVHFRVFGERPEANTTCTNEWFDKVQKALIYTK